MNKPSRKTSMSLALTLLITALSLSGCANRSTVYVPPPAPPAKPSLSSSARQNPDPSICSPTCFSKLKQKQADWQKRLTEQ